ncbi:MAG TPA: arginase family protein [Candidatus Dormibacteraeota bacterium]|nr:arginase family protein [Candidatus Dormibacteraeota bacterium]
MTAKLIRHPDQLALVGAPTSAAAPAAGVERGPAALRDLGILDRLRAAGYQVADPGDLPSQLFQPDPGNPRARNLKSVLAILEGLRVRVEQASKAHAFPLILGGDATVLVALVAGLRRQAPSLGLIHVSRYADLHTPTDTEDGFIGSMTVSHLVGQGAAELVRFWKSPPLVREPDLVAFGLDETDAIDRERLGRVAIRDFTIARIRSLGVRAAAEAALDHLRGNERDFVVHISWDAFSPEEVPGGPRGAAGGFSAAEVGEALNFFATREKFAGLSISGYDPELDPERRGGAAVVELVVGAMAARHTALLHPPVEKEEAEQNPDSVESAVSESHGGNP